MNKLSDTCAFENMTKHNFKFIENLKEIYQNISDYEVPFSLYGARLQGMKQYNYPLSKMILKATDDKIIRLIMSNEPVDIKKKSINIPATINTLSDSVKDIVYTDVSAIGQYIRYKDENLTPEILKIKELELYAYLHFGYLEYICKKYNDKLNSSAAFNKAVATAYSILFVKCIDRTFPISSNLTDFDIAKFLASVFALVKFFNKDFTTACNMILSTNTMNKKQIETSCKTLMVGKQFSNLEEFLTIFAEEFPQYIKADQFTSRLVYFQWCKMYGDNAIFGLDHACSFLKMITGVNINFYKDLIIQKPIIKEIDAMNKALLNIIE